MEVREAGLAGGVERLPVHECDHQDLAAGRILRDGNHEPRGIEPGHEFLAALAGGGVLRAVRNWCSSFVKMAANPRADWGLLHDNHRAAAKSMLRREAAL